MSQIAVFKIWNRSYVICCDSTKSGFLKQKNCI
ncbi:MAG: TRASH domain-containing protein [Candidatus Cloacimonetes bacterium]|nr:TRASH domain-containing protein [Candidatus Cloacimonadota bacterium]